MNDSLFFASAAAAAATTAAAIAAAAAVIGARLHINFPAQKSNVWLQFIFRMKFRNTQIKNGLIFNLNRFAFGRWPLNRIQSGRQWAWARTAYVLPPIWLVFEPWMTINHDKVVIYCISIVQTQYICLSLANELISGRDYRQTFPEIDVHTLRIVCKTQSQRRRSTFEWTIFLSMAISLQFSVTLMDDAQLCVVKWKGLELNILKSQNINSFDVTAFDWFTANLKEDHISQTITQAVV